VTVQVHPAGPESDTNVVVTGTVGTVSVTVTVLAAAGPLLVTVCV